MYALNTKKGTVIHNDDIGDLKGGVAIPINDKQVNIAKHLVGVVVFDRVQGVNEEKKRKELYGINKNTAKKE